MASRGSSELTDPTDGDLMDSIPRDLKSLRERCAAISRERYRVESPAPFTFTATTSEAATPPKPRFTLSRLTRTGPKREPKAKQPVLPPAMPSPTPTPVAASKPAGGSLPVIVPPPMKRPTLLEPKGRAASPAAEIASKVGVVHPAPPPPPPAKPQMVSPSRIKASRPFVPPAKNSTVSQIGSPAPAPSTPPAPDPKSADDVKTVSVSKPAKPSASPKPAAKPATQAILEEARLLGIPPGRNAAATKSRVGELSKRMGELEEKGGELGPVEQEGPGRPKFNPVDSWQGPDSDKDKDDDYRHVPNWAKDVDIMSASLGGGISGSVRPHAAQITRERAVRLAVERAIKTGMTPEQADAARKHAARRKGETEAAYASRIKALLGPGGELHRPSILDDHASNLLSMLGVEAPPEPSRPADDGPSLAGIEEAIRQKNAEIAASLRKSKTGRPSDQDIAELEGLKATLERSKRPTAAPGKPREEILAGMKGIQGSKDEEFDLVRAMEEFRRRKPEVARRLSEFRKQEAARRKSGPATDKKSQPGGQ